MYSVSAFFLQREDNKNSAQSVDSDVQSAQDNQQVYDVNGAEALYCNSSSLAPSEEYYSEIEYSNESPGQVFHTQASDYSEENIYEEVCDGSVEPIYSNETVAEDNLDIRMGSLSVGTPGQLSGTNSGGSSYHAELPAGPAGRVRTENMQNVEHFISSADDKLNTLTGMKSHPQVVQTVPISQKTAKTSRAKWMRSVASTAAEVAGGVKKTRVLLRSSDTGPSAQQVAKIKTGQKPVIQHTSLDDPHLLFSPARSVDEEPIYATVIPHRQTKNIQGTSSDSHSVTHSSPDGLRKLPSVCAEFATDSGCEWQGCPHLHVCAAWLERRCPILRRCLQTHSLRTAHNISVLRSHGWHQDEQAKLRRWLYFQGCCERLKTARLPPVCVDHARGGCRAQQCGSLHMCPNYLTDICSNRRCQLGHDLIGDNHNRYVLTMTGHEDTHSRVLLRDIKACMAAAPRLL